MAPRVLLLDLDDTILAFEAKAGACWEAVCTRYGEEAGCDPAALLGAVDEAREWYWSDLERHRRGRLDLARARREVVAGAFARLGLGPSPLVDEIAGAYQMLRDELLEPCPQAIDALGAFRAHGLRLALITNGEAAVQRGKIERFALAPYFEHILIEGELGFGKPDERVFRQALTAMGVEPSEAWMVGDHLEIDIAPAQRLGMRGVWVDHRGAGLPASSPVRPDHTVRGIGELVAAVARRG